MNAANRQFLSRRCIVKGRPTPHDSTLANSTRLPEGSVVESVIQPELAPQPNQR
jgi:hypothetical protein